MHEDVTPVDVTITGSFNTSVVTRQGSHDVGGRGSLNVGGQGSHEGGDGTSAGEGRERRSKRARENGSRERRECWGWGWGWGWGLGRGVRVRPRCRMRGPASGEHEGLYPELCPFLLHLILPQHQLNPHTMLRKTRDTNGTFALPRWTSAGTRNIRFVLPPLGQSSVPWVWRKHFDLIPRLLHVQQQVFLNCKYQSCSSLDPHEFWH